VDCQVADIGVRYFAATMSFFVIGGGAHAPWSGPNWAARATQYFNPQTFNVLISEHAALMIFAVVVPVFAGLGNFVIPRSTLQSSCVAASTAPGSLDVTCRRATQRSGSTNGSRDMASTGASRVSSAPRIKPRCTGRTIHE
jgi:hypothetical protein